MQYNRKYIFRFKENYKISKLLCDTMKTKGEVNINNKKIAQF